MDELKKYFINFLMIFSGITLGFFVENMREDNHKIFDQIGIEFHNKQFPFIPFNFTNRLFENSDLNKSVNYKVFLLSLEASKIYICSDKFIFDLYAFSGKGLHYNNIKKTLYKENQSLLKTLYKIQQN